MYLANLYRGWRGSPASFLSGTTSAASRHHRPSSPASCLLRTLGEVVPSGDAKLGSLWARSCPAHHPARPFLLASALVPPSASPSSSCPRIPEQPPAASPGCKEHLPETQSLSRQDTRRPPAPGLSPSRELSGPESGSAEVPGPATPALSREAQPQSPPALPGGTISVRTGEEFASDVRISGTISHSERWDL